MKINLKLIVDTIKNTLIDKEFTIKVNQKFVENTEEKKS
jgi:hypothetical protein